MRAILLFTESSEAVAYRKLSPPSQHLIGLKAKDVLQRVSVAVMRACADGVCQQFAKSPHVALTPAHRYGWTTRATLPRGENGSAF